MSTSAQDQHSFGSPTSGMTRSYTSPRTLFGMVMTLLAGACLIIALIPLFLVLFYVLTQGANRLNLDLFTKLPPPPGLKGGGVGNAIIGTLMTVGIGTLISLPFGVLAAVYLSEFSKGTTARWIRFATNVLAGVPSIIAGIFAYGIIVVTMGGFSAVAGGVALAVLMLPTIVRTTDEALQIVPQDIRWASAGVGASNYQTVLRIVLPAAIPAIITGVTLAIARAAGETAPLIFTALNSPFWPRGIWKPTPSLSVLIYNFASVPFEAQQELAWAASFLLVVLILLTSILARWATRKSVY
ncbi:phosphate ABC transporter permease PstA [Allocoleopsis franciscana]|uniref:Phosphate transport system permease protein PstA n=1 Tax=Allocoleopsis franciscana PCC 7113 TaxID=1173027 RepID=K9W968_9CYAN|nr:phosphate ABC transporter permease PstA [Allocoleopsis franciscana]AFZ16935.1 phosphate ABC transporter membrane protein 2, PhoT family [Allocoleopsis franciscana PCC 7113]